MSTLTRDSLPHIAAFEENLFHCSSCNYCVDAVWDEWGIDHVCPTLLHHSPAHGYSGKGYIAMARAWFEGAVLDPMMLAERAFTCTTCGNCEEVCPIGMHPMRIAVALRAELADRGHAPEYALRLRDAAMAADGRSAWAAGLEGNADATFGLIAGCGGADVEVDEARAAFRLLQAAGVAVRPVADAPACGGTLAGLGFVREAAERRAALDRHLADAGITKVAVVGAECLAHIAAGEAAAGRPAESVLETIATALAEDRLRLTPRAANPPPGQVGYLDPCHLTKKAHGLAERGLAALARDLLGRLGVTVVEPAAAPRFQVCCGAAGGMPEAQPEAATRMARVRLDEFAGRGAPVVVTAGPLCAAHLQRNAEADGPTVRGLYGFLLDHFDAMPGSTQG